MLEDKKQDEDCGWGALLAFFWFCCCFGIIYKNYYVYNFYTIVGRLETLTILGIIIFLVFACFTKNVRTMENKWYYLFQILCTISVAFIPVTIVFVAMFIKMQYAYELLKNSDFYYYISQFITGLISPFL